MSSTSIIKFDGFVENYIDEEQLRLTVKLSPTQYGPTSYEDVFQAFDRAGLNAEDIRGVNFLHITVFIMLDNSVS